MFCPGNFIIPGRGTVYGRCKEQVMAFHPGRFSFRERFSFEMSSFKGKPG